MKNKLKLFIKKNGLLTLLFLCVCFVAASTVFLATRDLGTSSEDLEMVEEEEEQDNIDVDDLTKEELDREIFNEHRDLATRNQETEETEETEEVEEQDDIEEVEEEVEAEVEEESSEEEIEFIESEPRTSENMSYPVEGEIITEFVDDSLIYSETLDEWRTHLGIDIKAAVDTKVAAPLGGVIKSVYEDELWGKVVIIDHENGLESKLANLGTTEMVKEGLEVAKGDHIGTVGKTAKVEMLMDDHLHFEVIKDGKNIDPRSILE